MYFRIALLSMIVAIAAAGGLGGGLAFSSGYSGLGYSGLGLGYSGLGLGYSSYGLRAPIVAAPAIAYSAPVTRVYSAPAISYAAPVTRVYSAPTVISAAPVLRAPILRAPLLAGW